jgi:hypothetical protein
MTRWLPFSFHLHIIASDLPDPSRTLATTGGDQRVTNLSFLYPMDPGQSLNLILNHSPLVGSLISSGLSVLCDSHPP